MLGYFVTLDKKGYGALCCYGFFYAKKSLWYFVTHLRYFVTHENAKTLDIYRETALLFYAVEDIE